MLFAGIVGFVGGVVTSRLFFFGFLLFCGWLGVWLLVGGWMVWFGWFFDCYVGVLFLL